MIFSLYTIMAEWMEGEPFLFFFSLWLNHSAAEDLIYASIDSIPPAGNLAAHAARWRQVSLEPASITLYNKLEQIDASLERAISSPK